jgi:hypothetical protein
VLCSTDDEEEVVVQTRTHKKHKKLDFSGEDWSDLVLCLFCAQPCLLEPF